MGYRWNCHVEPFLMTWIQPLPTDFAILSVVTHCISMKWFKLAGTAIIISFNLLALAGGLGHARQPLVPGRPCHLCPPPPWHRLQRLPRRHWRLHLTHVRGQRWPGHRKLHAKHCSECTGKIHGLFWPVGLKPFSVNKQQSLVWYLLIKVNFVGKNV